MRAWIDLSNSPHPLLFEPIARQLEARGVTVSVTARDNAQTVELARQRWPDVEVLGGPSPAGRVAKGLAMLERVRALASWARRERPDVALSHNSYAQIVSARLLGIRTVTAMDYEHQPANHLAFRLADAVLLPAALASSRLRVLGATSAKTHFYDGLKEEIYLGDFDPSPDALAAAGVERGPDTIVVVARTPPAGALYHRGENPLFVEALRIATSDRRSRCVILTRRAEQRRALAELGLPKVALPEQALDARSLLYAADLVIGAGGTMTREAALLGLPTVSLFAGPSPAVDRWLEARGSLRRVSTSGELPYPRQRSLEPRPVEELRARSDQLAAKFVDLVLLNGSRKQPRAVALPQPSAAAPSGAMSPSRSRAVELARGLSGWATERAWRGTDPYDALNARRRLLKPWTKTPLGRRLLLQAAKRSPLDLRRALDVPLGTDAASLALAVSAYARGGFLAPDENEVRLHDAIRRLELLRSRAYKEACWGYHFPFQSRVFFYARGEPNTIATAFAGSALLDAYSAAGDERLLEQARSVGRFFTHHVPQTKAEPGAYFGYLPGDRSPIHNSNVLVAALLARLAASGDDGEGFADRAAEAIRYTVARQRPDGSWPYGERPDLAWVDGFHTGYVLDALRTCGDAGVSCEESEEAWARGIRFYRRELFLADGTPKYKQGSVLPIDAQCVAQGIQTFATAARHDSAHAESARAVFAFAVRRMFTADGVPVFQRHRLWTNRIPHMRWVVAPMLLALAHLIDLERDQQATGDRLAMVA
jgi:predicted glycosyltransferase